MTKEESLMAVGRVDGYVNIAMLVLCAIAVVILLLGLYNILKALRNPYRNERVPEGLIRYDKNGDNDVAMDVVEIVVDNEKAKEQLLKTLQYFHDMRGTDTDIVMVNKLIHIYQNPDMVVVKKDEFTGD